MPEYRRVFIEGGTYAFTVVTHRRQPLFNDPVSREILFNSIQRIQYLYPFEQIAYCLLPDHIHCIWTLPAGDSDYPIRWKLIKCKFSRLYQDIYGPRPSLNRSKIKRGEVAIWQRRFWEHTIKDDNDLYNHINYIHFNPIKHGFVDNPHNWEWSSYIKYELEGYYPDPWHEFSKIDDKRDYGE
jgi:putative transposase